MKIRNGFISNSSASSFLILGLRSPPTRSMIEGFLQQLPESVSSMAQKYRTSLSKIAASIEKHSIALSSMKEYQDMIEAYEDYYQVLVRTFAILSPVEKAQQGQIQLFTPHSNDLEASDVSQKDARGLLNTPIAVEKIQNKVIQARQIAMKEGEYHRDGNTFVDNNPLYYPRSFDFQFLPPTFEAFVEKLQQSGFDVYLCEISEDWDNESQALWKCSHLLSHLHPDHVVFALRIDYS